MDRPDDTSKARSGRNRNATDAPRSASLDPDVSAETSSRTPQQQRIEAQRAQLLQAHGVLRCLYEVLLHAECHDAVFYAEAAHVAANLVNNSVEELDSVRLNAALLANRQGSPARVLCLALDGRETNLLLPHVRRPQASVLP